MTKALEWFRRGNSNVDPFDSFSDYWRGFNNLYFSTEQIDERRKIRHFLQAQIQDADAAGLLASHSQEISILVSSPVIDMRGNGHDTAPFLAEYVAADRPAAKLAALSMIIYQVRCNFEHGQKSPSSERDLALCIASGKITAAIIGVVAGATFGDKV